MSNFGVLAGTTAAMTCAALVAAPSPAQAQEFVPCNATALRNAITRANTTPGPAVLYLSPRCAYTLTTPDAGDPDNGLPVVTSEINVRGSGSTIRRVSSVDFRILKVEGPGGRLTLNNLTIRDGRDASGGEGGGGIANFGQLTLNDVQVTRNSTTQSGAGGGIVSAGTLTIRNSTLSFNVSTANNGGGLYSSGSATLSDTTVNGNTARDSGGGIDGRGTLAITSSAVTDNAAGDVGGLHLFGATTTIADTRIQGNTSARANSRGAGIQNVDGTLTMNRVTVFANRNLGSGSQGGGIANISIGGVVPTTATIRNSSVTHNYARSAPGGILNEAGTVTLVATPVENNIPTDCTPSVPSVPGCAS
ncbi:hypothetical protein ADL00_45005 [Streptomyces sp. AS58]|uniref:hypothetical protein n=1 Tax=Streptomyces sp. AS58 TaxID=1519489 RepID=UPI0006B05D37|nr:hypothetical protein [Streptomyces sp. AS58]KOV49946.1 hypothetical protein ADL00_45005 [Streptomyces sp. AS58]